MSSNGLLDRACALRALIEGEAEAAEELKTMTDPVVGAIAEAGLFHLMVPRALGGHEADIDTILDVAEEISFADGSVGWSYAQNVTVMSFSAFLDPAFAMQVASSRAAAGMFGPLGQGRVEDGGYRVSGKYPFGSGSSHADFIGGAVVIADEALPPLARMRGVLVPASSVALKDNWDVMGLRGTGSWDFEIPEQWVDAGQTFSMLDATVVSGGPLYGLGPIVLAGVASTGWALGVARRALDEIATIGRAGRMRMGSLPMIDQPAFQEQFGFHDTALRAARTALRTSYRTAIDSVEGEDPKRIEKIQAAKATSSWVVHVAKQATTFAWERAGSAGIRNPNRLQRCFRDICVGAGHLVWDPRNYAEFAQARLELQP